MINYVDMAESKDKKYTLSPDQVAAMKQIGSWYRAGGKGYITLGGYAGTGKTTLVTYVRQGVQQLKPDAKVAFCAYTGKAARVLADTLKAAGVPKRKDYVGTLHGLIYTAEIGRDGAVSGWKRKTELPYDLVILDEASMVGEAQWLDLLSFKKPVLAAGDHGQLPPVGSSFNLMADPMIRLERIFRQAETSPIIELATMARTSGSIPAAAYSDEVVKYSRANDETPQVVDELITSWRPDHLLLCGMNHTRVKLNQAIRVSRDIETAGPQTGDRVVCLRNNNKSGVVNGQTGTIIEVSEAEDGWLEASIELDGESTYYHGYIWGAQFGSKDAAQDIPVRAPDGQRGDVFDFGYALTVHKAQGSQADTVIVFEERTRHMDDEDWRRWLYTAVTRAQRRLVIIGD